MRDNESCSEIIVLDYYRNYNDISECRRGGCELFI